MKLDKLYKVLVVGGSLLTGSCGGGGSTTPPPPSGDMSTPIDQTYIDWISPAADANCTCSGSDQASCYCQSVNQGVQICCWLVNDPCCSTCHPG